MLKLALATSLASMLAGCGVSRQMPPRSDFVLPPPPMALTEPCSRTPIEALLDGTLNAAGVERALRQRDIDLARCDAKREAGAAAWPKAD